jgi:hypothetical protein
MKLVTKLRKAGRDVRRNVGILWRKPLSENDDAHGLAPGGEVSRTSGVVAGQGPVDDVHAETARLFHLDCVMLVDPRV